jgi:hypothetical protein
MALAALTASGLVSIERKMVSDATCSRTSRMASESAFTACGLGRT